jgi:integrase/recombinase XerD
LLFMGVSSNEQILIYFEEYLSHKALASSTIVNYLADLRAYLRWAKQTSSPNFLIIDTVPDHVQRYRYFLVREQKRAVSTTNRHLMSLRKFFTYAVHRGLITLNPAAGVALATGNNESVSKVLTQAEVEVLLEAARQGSRASLTRRDLAIVHLILYTGLRVSEIIELHKDDLVFDFPGLHLRVRATIGRSESRNLPLSGELCKVLDDYLRVMPESTTDYLFLSREGRPLAPRTVQRIISETARVAGLSGVSAQSMRRTYAVNLFQKTKDMSLVCKRLGHQTTSITEQYLSIHT